MALTQMEFDADYISKTNTDVATYGTNVSAGGISAVKKGNVVTLTGSNITASEDKAGWFPWLNLKDPFKPKINVILLLRQAGNNVNYLYINSNGECNMKDGVMAGHQYNGSVTYIV